MTMNLDDLLSESVDLAKKSKEIKQSQKAGRKGKPQEEPKPVGWLNKDEMQQHAFDVACIKARTEGWKSTDAVLLCYAQVCSHCGSEHTMVDGIFVKKYHEKLRVTNLIKPGGAIDYAGLPRQVEIRTEQVPMCFKCKEEQGWADAIVNII